MISQIFRPEKLVHERIARTTALRPARTRRNGRGLAIRIGDSRHLLAVACQRLAGEHHSAITNIQMRAGADPLFSLVRFCGEGGYFPVLFRLDIEELEVRIAMRVAINSAPQLHGHTDFPW